MQIADDLQQPRPAEHLVGDRLQSLLQIYLHIRHHELLGHLLLLDQDYGSPMCTSEE